MRNVLIIGEAGVNHNGDINIARKLIDVAVEAGVDMVKFQTFITEEGITGNAEKAEYQLSATDKNETQFEMIKKLELDREAHEELIRYCNQKGICGSYQRPLRKISIDGLSPKTSGMSFFRMSFLREIYSGMEDLDRLRRWFAFQTRHSFSNSKPYLKPCLRNELSST
mgnify:CR=1 FL=1